MVQWIGLRCRSTYSSLWTTQYCWLLTNNKSYIKSSCHIFCYTWCESKYAWQNKKVLLVQKPLRLTHLTWGSVSAQDLRCFEKSLHSPIPTLSYATAIIHIKTVVVAFSDILWPVISLWLQYYGRSDFWYLLKWYYISQYNIFCIMTNRCFPLEVLKFVYLVPSCFTFIYWDMVLHKLYFNTIIVYVAWYLHCCMFD